MSPTSAAIFYRDRQAGILRKTENGYEFTYDQAYAEDPTAPPISLNLPKTLERYLSKDLFPFFEGLLPEGWLLELKSMTLKIDKDDKFGLLLHSGSDTIGAVTARPLETHA